MVKILAFPKRKSSQHPDAGYAPGRHDPLASARDDGRLSTAEARIEPCTRGDWDNQELAGLYRVEGLLVQANIRISTGRGLTDEGDPWFVFCRDDGDVFVHLARMDGSYLLDSPGLSEILRGSDFSELISRFVKQVADKAAAASNNVVALRPRALHDQTIRLHPSVMLAALVWSLYVASDDFVGAAHAMEGVAAASGGETPAELIDGLAAHPEIVLPENALAELSASLGYPTSAATESNGTSPAPAGYGDAPKAAIGNETRILSSSSTSLATHGIAASLAVLAVGYGFHQITDSTASSGTSDMPADRSETSNLIQLSPSGESILFESSSTESGVVDLPEAYFSGSQTTQTIKGIEFEADVAVLKGDQSALTHEADTEAPKPAAPIQKPVEEMLVSETVVKAAKPDIKPASPATSGTAATLAAADPAPVQNETQTVLMLVTQHAGLISEYRVGELVVATTLDYSGLDKLLTHINVDSGGLSIGDLDAETIETAPPVTAPIVTTPNAPAPTGGPALAAALGPQYSYYDEKAKDFVSYFIREAIAIELVQFNSEIVLVDMSAIDDPSDVVYTLRWVTDDGHVISTIGHLQDFIEYGIA